LQKKVGLCGCGNIAYEINSEFLNIVNCHCNMCRRNNGSSFSTYGVIPLEAFSVTHGKDLLSRYSENNGIKHFCSQCGTPLFNTNENYAGLCMIFVGTLKVIGDNIPKVNIWCENKLSWIDEISSILSLKNGVPSKNT